MAENQGGLIELVEKHFNDYKTRINGNQDSDYFRLKQNAFNIFADNGLPTIKKEYWKYNNLGFLNKNIYDFSPVHLEKFVLPKNAELAKFMSMPGYKLVLVNGHLISSLSDIEQIKSQSFTVDTILSDFDGRIEPSQYEKNPLLALNTALSNETLHIKIPKNTEPDKSIIIININDSSLSGYFINPAIKIDAEQSSKAEIINAYFSTGDKPQFTNEYCQIYVGANANLKYYQYQNNNKELMTHTQIYQEQDSHFESLVISLSGKYLRNNLSAEHLGSNIETHYLGTFFVDGNNFVDNHTFVDHAKPHCYSNENYRGIVTDNGTAVFNGKILVRQDAQKTNAYQSNKNVLLSDNATINTKPELEIYADDVKCSHGATSGALDKNYIFYLRARGISEDLARAMILQAFVGEIFENVKNEEFKSVIENAIAQKLNMAPEN